MDVKSGLKNPVRRILSVDIDRVENRYRKTSDTEQRHNTHLLAETPDLHETVAIQGALVRIGSLI